MSAADKLAQVLAEHGEMIQFHAGNGSTEPREAWAECNCGEHLWDWQEYYNETPDEPEDAFRAHQAAVALAHLTAEGWAQGREEWGVGYIKGATGESRIVKYDTADIAEIAASGLGAVFPESMARVVRRRVTDWEPVETGDQK